MNSLQSTLEELELFLQKIGAPILDILKPGIDRNHMDQSFSGVNLPFSEDLYSMFAWRNGINDSKEKLIGEITLFTNGVLLSVEECIDIYRYNTIENNRWDKDYFPLFSSGGGDFLLINLGKSNLQAAILLYSPALLYSELPVTIYDSLELLFVSVLECYRQKAYYFDGRMFEKNVDLEFSICAKNNPQSKYWKDE